MEIVVGHDSKVWLKENAERLTDGNINITLSAAKALLQKALQLKKVPHRSHSQPITQLIGGKGIANNIALGLVICSRAIEF